ncbi:MAG: transketolase [Candidatus Gracilibacteria bacterium]|nr:transketolase [Candidatus Gracilibacteria bacterium]
MQKKSNNIRQTIIKMITKSKSSHIGGALSTVDILNSIYSKFFKENDKLILSKGHSGSALYATLAEYGKIDKNNLIDTYCQNGSKFGGHITYGSMPGVDASAGSLGHGLSIGCGFALADKNRNVFVITGDGELNEGSIWEAVMFSFHHKLSNLIWIIDRNGQQACGNTDDIMKINNLNDILKSFGWFVQEIDGHDFREINNAFTNLNNELSNVIIANTIKGKGVSFMEDNLTFHYRPPNDEQYQLALNELSK